MKRLDFKLGDDPFSRLAVGRVTGTMACNDGTERAVSVRIRGAHSRRFPRKSLQVDLTGEGLRDDPPAGHRVHRIHLNADYIDPTLMRSALSYSLFQLMGVPAPLCRHASVTIGGQFSGLYVALESVDRDFCQRRGWPPGSIFYAVNRNANFGLVSPLSRALKNSLDAGYRAVEGADTAPLRRLVMEVNLATDHGFSRVAEQWLDVTKYLYWLMVAVFVGNRDGFVHNYALYRNPQDGRFCIIPWDYDATWGIDIHGRPAPLDRVPLTGWNKLSSRLMKTPQYRQMYKRFFLSALNGPLSPSAVHTLVEQTRQSLDPWIIADKERLSNVASFDEAVGVLKRWATDRHAQLSKDLTQF